MGAEQLAAAAWKPSNTRRRVMPKSRPEASWLRMGIIATVVQRYSLYKYFLRWTRSSAYIFLLSYTMDQSSICFYHGITSQKWALGHSAAQHSTVPICMGRFAPHCLIASLLLCDWPPQYELAPSPELLLLKPTYLLPGEPVGVPAAHKQAAESAKGNH